MNSENMIKRAQLSYAQQRLFKGKALIIYGARQVGKTTFCEQLLQGLQKKVLRLNGDYITTRQELAEPSIAELQRIIGDHEVVFIDEAQRLKEPGLLLKIIVDQMPQVQVIATGSSSFTLAGHVNEPLTGRKYVLHLSPLSYRELVDHTDYLSEKNALSSRLLYGSYPEVVTDPDMAEEHLRLLAESYLYKDLFALEEINRPQLFDKLIQALALQVGNEVRLSELAQTVGADHKTTAKYLDLLEQAFVIFMLPAFSRNVRNEIKKGRKVYFYDNGIINAITSNFNTLNNRNDVGALWENYMVAERRKFLEQQRLFRRTFFWRTTQQQEVDYIEEEGEQLMAVEFKWKDKGKKDVPLTFRKAYPHATSQVISSADYHEFLYPI